MNSCRPARRLGLFGSLVASAAFSACGPGEPAPSDSSATPAAGAAAVTPSVEILSPAEGDSVTLPFTLTLGATGLEVVAATGQREVGKGHHHLVIDADAAEGDTVALGGPPSVIHMGNGASERVLDSLPPGPHRIIAVFAWGDHVPMAGVKRDTVTIVVR
jgi:Domain of unknown function (DUF4399)